jgi:hypothetical protein
LGLELSNKVLRKFQAAFNLIVAVLDKKWTVLAIPRLGYQPTRKQTHFISVNYPAACRYSIERKSRNDQLVSQIKN